MLLERNPLPWMTATSPTVTKEETEAMAGLETGGEGVSGGELPTGPANIETVLLLPLALVTETV